MALAMTFGFGFQCQNCGGMYQEGSNGLCAGCQQKQKPLEKSIIAEPIEAWRVWQVVHTDQLMLNKEMLGRLAERYDRGENPFVGLLSPALHSVGVQHRWQKTETARCTQTHDPRHESPAVACSCGIWGLKDEEYLCRALANYGSCAYGRVQMWGRIVEHDHGYRAQYAKPFSITLVGADATPETAAAIELEYGCEVVCGDYPKGMKVSDQLNALGPGAFMHNAASATWSSSLIQKQQFAQNFALPVNGPGHVITFSGLVPPMKKARWLTWFQVFAGLFNIFVGCATLTGFLGFSPLLGQGWWPWVNVALGLWFLLLAGDD